MNQVEPRTNSKLLGTILIALGVLFLLKQVFNFEVIRISFGEISWPLFPIVAGLVITLLGLGLKQSAVTIIGTMATVAGLILWFHDSTGTYQTWAYAWALIMPTLSISNSRGVRGVANG